MSPVPSLALWRGEDQSNPQGACRTERCFMHTDAPAGAGTFPGTRLVCRLAELGVTSRTLIVLSGPILLLQGQATFEGFHDVGFDPPPSEGERSAS